MRYGMAAYLINAVLVLPGAKDSILGSAEFFFSHLWTRKVEKAHSSQDWISLQ